MATGDTYQIIDKQTYLSQDCINVYYYRQVAGTGGANDLWAAFTTDIVPQVATIQHTSLEHVGLDVYNTTDLTDFEEGDYPSAITGVRNGAPMPSFVSWTYKLTRTDRTTRNGRKSFPGVVEEDTGNNGAQSAMIPVLEALATVLSANITDVSGNEWEMVIYGKPTAPPSSLPLRINPVSSVTRSHLSTQNSRKAF